MNRIEAQKAIDELYYYFYNLYLKEKIDYYDWEDFKEMKSFIKDLTTFDHD